MSKDNNDNKDNKVKGPAPNTRLSRNSSLVWRQLGDEIVILDEDGTRVTTLNATAAVIWTLLEDDRSLEEIADEISNQFEVAPDQAIADVQAFCDQLIEQGLASAVPPASANPA